LYTQKYLGYPAYMGDTLTFDKGLMVNTFENDSVSLKPAITIKERSER
jgi:hypothetical protein